MNLLIEFINLSCILKGYELCITYTETSMKKNINIYLSVCICSINTAEKNIRKQQYRYLFCNLHQKLISNNLCQHVTKP